MRTFSSTYSSSVELIKASLRIESIFRQYMIEGEYYLTETFTLDDKHFLVVTIWNSKE